MSFARVRALVVVGVLAVAAIVFVVVALVKDSQAGQVASGGCAPGSVLASVQLPDDPDEVTLRVFNGTSTPNLAQQVTNEFKNRRFKIQPATEDKKKLKSVAKLRYGPEAVGYAQLVLAYFLGNADMEYNAKRKGPVVDVVLGAKFRQLATTTEVNQSLVEIGEPDLPVGACLAPDKKQNDGS